MAWIIFFSGVIPDGFDGAESRILKYPESDFVMIEKGVKALLEKYPKAYTEMYWEGEEFEPFMREVGDLHELMRVSSFPLRISSKDGYVLLAWSSGLAGGYEILLADSSELPSWFRDRYSKKIYESVHLIPSR